jgi:hypothetical protein
VHTLLGLQPAAPLQTLVISPSLPNRVREEVGWVADGLVHVEPADDRA